MQRRKPGNSNLESWALGLGCMGMSFYCGPFAKEEPVGEAPAPVRSEILIATKFGFDLQPGLDPRGMKGRPAPNGRPEHIRDVAEASLKRFRADVIDLFYQHRVDPGNSE